MSRKMEMFGLLAAGLALSNGFAWADSEALAQLKSQNSTPSVQVPNHQDRAGVQTSADMPPAPAVEAAPVAPSATNTPAEINDAKNQCAKYSIKIDWLNGSFNTVRVTPSRLVIPSEGGQNNMLVEPGGWASGVMVQIALSPAAVSGSGIYMLMPTAQSLDKGMTIAFLPAQTPAVVGATTQISMRVSKHNWTNDWDYVVPLLFTLNCAQNP